MGMITQREEPLGRKLYRVKGFLQGHRDSATCTSNLLAGLVPSLLAMLSHDCVLQCQLN